MFSFSPFLFYFFNSVLIPMMGNVFCTGFRVSSFGLILKVTWCTYPGLEWSLCCIFQYWTEQRVMYSDALELIRIPHLEWDLTGCSVTCLPMLFAPHGSISHKPELHVHILFLCGIKIRLFYVFLYPLLDVTIALTQVWIFNALPSRCYAYFVCPIWLLFYSSISRLGIYSPASNTKAKTANWENGYLMYSFPCTAVVVLMIQQWTLLFVMLQVNLGCT